MPTSPATPTARRRTTALKSADSGVAVFPSSSAASSAVDTSKTHPASMPSASAANGSGSGGGSGGGGGSRPAVDEFAKVHSPRGRKGKGKMSLVGLKDVLEDGAHELTVRLRAKGEGEYKVVAPGTPWDEIDLSEVDFLRHKAQPARKQSWKAWLFGRKFFFPAGIVFGLALALTLTPLSQIPPEIIDTLTGHEAGDGGGTTAFQSISRAISQMSRGIQLPEWADLEELTSNITFVENAKKALANRDFNVGNQMVQQGYEKKHPMILIPGIVSTGLESWGTSEDSKSFFRKRLWGTTTMIQAVLSDKNRWVDALSLDPVTGLDPVGYKVRAAQGLDAASEFIQGYWVWQKIVQNLAALGYDPNSVDMAAYDWRLAYYNLEIRDAYFTRLKAKIELYRKTNNQKVVLCSHSMGGTVVLYFLKWVEAMPEDDVDGAGFGGGGGPQWVEENVEAVINIAGTMLGVAKSMTAFLSGEMKDTVEIHPAGSWVLEKMFSRKERARLFRRWPGSTSMWMKGGDRIWGSHKSAPDDPDNTTATHGVFFSFRREEQQKSQQPSTSSGWKAWMTGRAGLPVAAASNMTDGVAEEDQTTSSPPKASELNSVTVRPNLTMNEAGAYVLTHTPNTFQRMLAANYSNGFETDVEQLKRNNHDHRKWTNPLEVQLPIAPSLKIYCLYGHGKETERSYWYMQGEYEFDEDIQDVPGGQCMTTGETDASGTNATSDVTCRPPLDMPLARKHYIDTEVNHKGSTPEVRSGVKFGEGDGTVPLLSLGAMCARGWKEERYNPGGVKIITQEFKHEPEGLDLRGGEKTGDHIDILGSTALNEAVVKIASGHGHTMKDRFVSRIREYADNIDWS